MTRPTKWAGFSLSAVILILLLFNIWREPARQQKAQQSYQEKAVAEGVELYAEYCADCHGAAGEGLNANPALNQDFVRQQDDVFLLNTIARGRIGTDMASYVIDEGGILTHSQITSLVTLLQYANWQEVELQVLATGFSPPAETLIAADSDFASVFATVEDDPDSTVARGRVLFESTCVECHGDHGEGTADAPQINSAYVQSMSAMQLLDILNYGVSGTEMDSFRDSFSTEDKAALIYLLQHWNATESGPVPQPTIDTSGVTLTGKELFETWCAICHGVQGEGGSIAPPLNDVPALSTEFIMARVRDGKNAMPPFPATDLPDPELVVLIDYAQNNIVGSGLPQFSDEELLRANELYEQHCAECHNVDGTGVIDMGPPLVKFPPLHASYISYFTRFGSEETPGIPPSEVSDSELALIIAHIYSLQP